MLMIGRRRRSESGRHPSPLGSLVPAAPPEKKERGVRTPFQSSQSGLYSASARACDFQVVLEAEHPNGNRDFAIGDGFAQETGAKILPDPTVVDLYGETVLLSHGDAYCTDDVQYQTVRKMTRDPEWLAMMLKKPLQERLSFAAQARAASAAHGGAINEKIADVNQGAIEQALRRANVDTMLHGHTHRPGQHRFTVDGEPASRIVLGDWFEQGSVVRWDKNGPKLSVLKR